MDWRLHDGQDIGPSSTTPRRTRNRQEDLVCFMKSMLSKFEGLGASAQSCHLATLPTIGALLTCFFSFSSASNHFDKLPLDKSQVPV